MITRLLKKKDNFRESSVLLRGYHLLCLLTYQGLGYSAAFVDNLDRVVERIASGAWIDMVEGPDDICRPKDSEQPIDLHCSLKRIVLRDRLAYTSISTYLGYSVQVGSQLQLNPKTVQQLRLGFSKGLLRGACTGCEWQTVCTNTAEQNYQQVRLYPPSQE